MFVGWLSLLSRRFNKNVFHMIYDERMRLHETCVNNNNFIIHIIPFFLSTVWIFIFFVPALALARVGIVIVGIFIQIHERTAKFVGENKNIVFGSQYSVYVCGDFFVLLAACFAANKFLKMHFSRNSYFYTMKYVTTWRNVGACYCAMLLWPSPPPPLKSS